MKFSTIGVCCLFLFLFFGLVLLGSALVLALVPAGGRAAGLGDHLVALATGTVAADQWHGLGPGLGLSVALAPLDAPVVAAAQA